MAFGIDDYTTNIHTSAVILLDLQGPAKVIGCSKNVFPFGMIIVGVPDDKHVAFHAVLNACMH